jgi:glucuronoarabinoxylan endo-1,4-beta-xylanase
MNKFIQLRCGASPRLNVARTLFYVVALGAGLFSFMPEVLSQNLATNPGFETGNTSGWQPFGSATISAETDQVHSGNYAALVASRTATYMGIAQPLTGVLQAGQTYAISAWMRLVNSTNQTAFLTIQLSDNNGTSYTQVATNAISTNGWTQLVAVPYTFNYAGTLSGLTVYAELPNNATAAYYLDDLVILQTNLPSMVTNTAQCVVDWANVHQRIDGFGASSAWRSSWTSAEADMLFSTNSGMGVSFDGKSNFNFTGIGLSLLRSRIAPGGGTVEGSIMQMAQARGAKVWSTPWSPAANFKSNTNIDGGGFIGNPANYQAYAEQLAGYVVNMKTQYGVNLYALSLQNEPDANVTTYESCNWSGQQFHDFVPYLSNALASNNVSSTKIIFPESQSWADPSNLVAAAMSDDTSNDVSIVANHDYVANNNVGDQATPAAIDSYGKTLWETEVALLSGSDSSIDNAVYWAGRIHLYLTAAQVNAWHYWWLLPGTSTGNEGLTDTNGIPAKRMYAIGNFSRFVRPNYYRIGVNDNSGPAEISAYKDSTSPNFAIVAINPSPSTLIAQSFTLANCSAHLVTPWVTSGALSLAAQSPIMVSNASFTYTLPALSVVTFVGETISNTPPTLASVADQTVNAGIELVITNMGSDTNLPAPTLTYSLLQAPTNAVLNPTNGVFIWRPKVGQANTTNVVSVEVSDNGAPPLEASNFFSVVVKPLALPALAVTAAAGQYDVVINGPEGPDYTLMESTDLLSWQALLSTNFPTLPWTFIETNMEGPPVRFYRVQIGP